MDVVTDLLRDVRSEDVVLNRSLWTPPWRIHIASRKPLAVITVLRGQAWIIHSDSPPRHLTTGDAALVTGRGDFFIGDSADSEMAPQMTTLPGGRVILDNGTQLTEPRMHLDNWPVDGTRTGSETGQTMLLTCEYRVRGQMPMRLINALPHVLVATDSERLRPVRTMLSNEVETDQPGQQAILDHLVDLLLLVSVRDWFTGDNNQPGWIRAHRDRVIGPALRLLHQHPERPWTVDDLATAVGVSRATFSRRFNDIVGEPPMKYLTNWRLTLAADLLARTDATVHSVAQRVGYGTAYSLSAALKREHGLRPSTLRAPVTNQPPTPTR